MEDICVHNKLPVQIPQPQNILINNKMNVFFIVLENMQILQVQLTHKVVDQYAVSHVNTIYKHLKHNNNTNNALKVKFNVKMMKM